MSRKPKTPANAETLRNDLQSMKMEMSGLQVVGIEAFQKRIKHLEDEVAILNEINKMHVERWDTIKCLIENKIKELPEARQKELKENIDISLFFWFVKNLS